MKTKPVECRCGSQLLIVTPIHPSPYVTSARRRIFFTTRCLLSFNGSAAPHHRHHPTSTTPCGRFLFELGYFSLSSPSSPSSLKLIFIGSGGRLFVKSVFRNSQCGVPSPLTRLNLPFQMKAVPERDGVVWPERRSPCLQTAGMWDVWSGGQEARKECQLCPCLSRAGSPFSSR